jgi:hypothetical protein
VEVEVHAYLTQASDKGVWSADVLAALLLRKESLLHIRVGSGLDELDMKINNPFTMQELNHSSLVIQLTA